MLEDAPKINRSLPIPLYYQLKERILTEIKNGDYPRDSIIPTELELSSMFDLSRTTVRQAIAELVQEGWLYRLPSKGTFVGSPKISQDLIKKIKSFNQTITEQGMIPRTEVITLKKIKASIVDSKIVRSLGLSKNDELIYLYRRRFANEEPIVICESYMSYEYCKEIFEHDLFKESLYSILDKNIKTKVFQVVRTVEAVAATSNDSIQLKILPGTPVQYFVSLEYNSFNEPIVYTEARYRGDRNRFEVSVFR